jgi:glucose-6-phosphate isomerase
VQAHVSTIQKTHLRDLMADADRCMAMTAYAILICSAVSLSLWVSFAWLSWLILVPREFGGIFLDYSRQQATRETMEKLLKLAEVMPVPPFLGTILEAEIVLLFDNLGFIRFVIGCQAQGEDWKDV